MATDIFVGSVAVGVVPDAHGWQRDLQAQLVPSSQQVGRQVGQNVSSGIVDSMKANQPRFARAGSDAAGAFGDSFRKRLDAALKALPKVNIDANSSQVDRKLADIRARMEALSSKTIGIDISAEQAIAEMKVLEDELKAVGDKGVDIKVKLDTDRARAQLVLFRQEVDKLQETDNIFDKIAGHLKKIGNQATGLQMFDKIFTGVSLATGLLEPAVASLTVSFMGLVSALSAAALGLGAWGIVAMGAAKPALAAGQALANAQQALQTAQNPAQVKAAESAIAKANQQIAGLDKAQQGLALSIANVNNEWQDWLAKVDTPVIGVMTHALGLIPSILKAIEPFLKPMSDALNVIITDMQQGLISPQFKADVKLFASYAGPMLVRTYVILRNVLEGVGGLIRAFLPEGVKVMMGLTRLSEKFAQWGKSMGPGRKGFQDIVQMAHRDGPILVDILKNVAAVLKDFIGAMASSTTLGNSTQLLIFLRDLTGILQVLFSNPWLANLVVWALIFQGALGKLAPAVKGVSFVIKALTTDTKDLSGAVKLLSMAFDFIAANPIVLIIAAIVAVIGIIVYLSLKSKAFRDFWKMVWHDILSIIQDVWHWIEHNWPMIVAILVGPVGIAVLEIIKHLHTLEQAFFAAWHFIDNYFVRPFEIAFNDLKRWIWNDFLLPIYNWFTKTLPNWFIQMKNWVVGFFASAIQWLLKAGRDIVTGLWNGLKNVWQSVSGWFTSLPGVIKNWFAAAGNWLLKAGGDVISGLLNGIKNAISGVGSWINNNVVQPIVGAVKHFFGISSPSTVMAALGQNIIQGLIHGILSSGANLGKAITTIFGGMPQALMHLLDKGLIAVTNLPRKALDALGGLAGKLGSGLSSLWHKVFGGGGSGVQQWAGYVAQALSMLGLPLSLTNQVLYQMQTESGGNPNAINLTDINAQMGDPSRGLMQVIGATFAQWHVPGTSYNIYDPLANIAAAINYARYRYGPSLMNQFGGLGSGHGYDGGGWLPTGVTMAINNTGYPELVVPQKQLASVGGTHYHAHFDGLTGQAIEGYVQGAFAAMNIQQGQLARVGRRR